MPRHKGERYLKWSHFAALLEAIEAGQDIPAARQAAGIPATTYRRLRSRWIVFEMEQWLTAQDPEGTPIDLYHLDELILARRTAHAGRPKGAGDKRPRKRPQYRTPRGLGAKAQGLSAGALPALPVDHADPFL